MLKRYGLLLITLVALLDLMPAIQAQNTPSISAKNLTALQPLLSLPAPQLFDNWFFGAETLPADYSMGEPIFNPYDSLLGQISNEAPYVLRLVDLRTSSERYFIFGSNRIALLPDWQELAVEEHIDGQPVHTTFINTSAMVSSLYHPSAAPYAGACQFHLTVIRTEPDSAAPLLDNAQANPNFEVLAVRSSDDWVLVRVGMQSAWINGAYGQMVGSCNALPLYYTPGSGRVIINTGFPDNDNFFSPDSRYLLIGGENGQPLRAYDINTGTLAYQIDTTSQIRFSPNGSLMYDSAAQVFNVDTGTSVFGDGSGWFYGMVFSGDSSEIATVGRDSVIRIYNLASGDQLRSLTLPSSFHLTEMEFSTDGRYLLLAITQEQQQTTVLWDLATSETDVHWGDASGAYFVFAYHGSSASSLQLTPDSNSLFGIVSNGNYWIEVWDTATHQMRFQVQDNYGYRPSLLLWDDSLIVANRPETKGAQIIGLDLQSGEVLAAKNLPYFQSFSPNKHWAVAEDENQTLTLWGVTTNTIQPTQPASATPMPTITPTIAPTYVPTVVEISVQQFAKQTATAQAALITPTSIP